MSAPATPEPDLNLGEATALTGVVVSGTQQDVRQHNLDAGAIVARMAATTVRRKCNQHRCAGVSCAHPNHRRDVDYLRHCLELLGLPGTHETVTAEDRAQLLVSLARQPSDGTLGELLGTENPE